MSNDSDVSASLAAVTALTRLENNKKEKESNNDKESYAKTSLNKLKNANDFDRVELKKLNEQLTAYLDRAKALEALNLKLLKEVEEERARQIPKNNNKKELAGELDQARRDLENESKDVVDLEIDAEKNEAARQEYINRIKFYQHESDLQKQKIAKLQQELADIDDERDYILKSANQVENDINKSQSILNKAENDLENLRNELADIRNKNKQLEFEMQTLQDEREFCKAVHDEEVAELRNSIKAIPSNRDLNKFYKDQLIQAVKDIKQDFKRLNQQQLDDLKKQKEDELEFFKENAEKQKAASLRKASVYEREVADLNLNQLPDANRQDREELARLNAKNNELTNYLASLEAELDYLKNKNADDIAKRENEISDLKQLNDNYISELGYWDRVTRAKLQSELVAYNGLLGSQLKLLDKSLEESNKVNNNNNKTENKPPQQTFPRPATPPKPVQETKPVSVSPASNVQQNNKPLDTSSGVIISSVSSSSSSSSAPAQENTNNQNRPSTVLISSTQSSSNKPPSPVVHSKQESQLQSTSSKYQGGIYDQLRKVFDMFDKDKSGYINSLEFQNILSSLDIQLTDDAYEQILREADLDNSRDISFDEFCKIMEPAIKGNFSRDELYKAFKHFDKDNSGYITVKELSKVLSQLGQSFTDQQIQNLVLSVDNNNDGKLDFEEFYTLLTRPLGTKQPVKRKSVTIVSQPITVAPVQEAPPKSKNYDVLKKIFDSFDKDKSGYINSNEFNDVLLALDLQISDDVYEDLLKVADLDKTRDISFAEFCKIMEPALSGDFNRDELYVAFKHFDKDNSGFITVKELSQIFSQIGQSFSEQQIAKMVSRVDKDNDGKLSFEEFVELMSTPLK